MHVNIAQFGDVHLQCVAKVSGVLGVADLLRSTSSYCDKNGFDEDVCKIYITYFFHF